VVCKNGSLLKFKGRGEEGERSKRVAAQRAERRKTRLVVWRRNNKRQKGATKYGGSRVGKTGISGSAWREWGRGEMGGRKRSKDYTRQPT